MNKRVAISIPIIIVLVVGVAYVFLQPQLLACRSTGEVPFFPAPAIYSGIIHDSYIELVAPHYDVKTMTEITSISRGDTLTLNHGGLWSSITELSAITEEDAIFEYQYWDTRDEPMHPCEFRISRLATPVPTYVLKIVDTQNLFAFEPLLLSPEEFGGSWDPNTFELITTDLSVQKTTADVGPNDAIQARIAVKSSPKSITDFQNIRYAVQTVRIYADEKTAATIFGEEYAAERAYVARYLPDEISYQPSIPNYLMGCTTWGSEDGQECFFKIQYGEYILEMSVPVDGTVITTREWEKVNQIVEEKLIYQVEGK